MAKTTITVVSGVDLTALPGSGSDYTITAVGDVPTGGWKDPELVPRSGASAPRDGIYDYDFVATKPSGFVTQVITKVRATYVLTNAPSSFLGVRVSSERNARIALADASTARARVVCLRGQLAASQGDCQTLRADNGDSYSLVGNLEGLKVGDRVYAAGTIADESFCGTNRTVVLTWISKLPPKL